MSPRDSPSPPSRTSSPSTRASITSSRVASGSDMQGTERTHKSATRTVFKQHTHQNSEVNKDSWAAEISGKISLVDAHPGDSKEIYSQYKTNTSNPTLSHGNHLATNRCDDEIGSSLLLRAHAEFECHTLSLRICHSAAHKHLAAPATEKA